LVEGGADINSVNEDGFTALMLASRNGHLEAVEALLEVPKIDTNKKNSYGSNAMHYAAMYAHREVVQALRRKGRVKKGE
ncbi:ankyrin repeat-containing domain protein, partial [Baffinella frigidus]